MLPTKETTMMRNPHTASRAVPVSCNKRRPKGNKEDPVQPNIKFKKSEWENQEEAIARKALFGLLKMMPLCVHHLPTGICLLYSSPVSFLEPLQSQDQQFGVMLVGERGEGDGRESTAFQPMHSSGIHCHSFLCCDVRTVLQGGHENQLPTAASSHQGQTWSQLYSLPSCSPPCP